MFQIITCVFLPVELSVVNFNFTTYSCFISQRKLNTALLYCVICFLISYSYKSRNLFPLFFCNIYLRICTLAARCRRPNIPELLFHCTYQSFVGSECELRCRRGFWLMGERQTNCTDEGFKPSINDNSCVRGKT